ncbi:MAG: hypothetical protein M3Q63_01630 [bacterium]|nr:hypothetical protein [bacterium]
MSKHIITMIPSITESKFEKITDADLSLKDYIEKHYLIAFFIVLLFIWALWMFITSVGPYVTLFVLILIPLLQYKYIKSRSEHAFLKNFAEKNGYTYNAQAVNLAETSTTYLKIGHGQFIDKIILGTYGGFPLRIFTFHTTIGENKNAQLVKFTVFELEFVGSTLNILIDAGKHPFPKNVLQHQKLQLEGNFNDHFNLYISKGYHLETLQVLTPDIMEILIDTSKHFSLEFIHNKLYIYADTELTNSVDMVYMYEFSHSILSKLAPVLARVKHSSISSPILSR